MIWLCLLLIPLGLAISLPATFVARAMGRRLGALDGPGALGQIKEAPRNIPNTGGIGVYAALAIPMVLIIAVTWLMGPQRLGEMLPALATHAEGLRQMTPLALVVLVGMTVLHLIGVIDDRRPLRPGSKLATMFAVATAVALSFDTRLLTLLDKYPGGYWLSILVTVVWIVAVINALNLIDNMDGLSGGVACIAALCFLAAALLQGQWFVAASLALLVGALLGFLVFNVPPASVFLGDGGSLVIGFWLAFLTVRTTYVQSDASDIASHPTSGAWYGVFMPILVLAVPLYDTASVMLLRWSQGKPLMVGDLQHVSHRLVRRGLSRRGAVLSLWGFTLVTGLAGVVLAHVPPWCAALIGAQTLVLLGVLGAIEFASDRHRRPDELLTSPPASARSSS